MLTNACIIDPIILMILCIGISLAGVAFIIMIIVAIFYKFKEK